MAEMRLQKFLARAGVASRRHAEELIAAGRVTVNGVRVTEMGVKVDPAADVVAVHGAPVALPEENATFLLHKPAGYVTTMSDPQGRPTVAALMADELLAHPGLFPVGRLDKDTEGLLLLTNQGDLVNQIMRSRYHHEKEYIVRVDRPIDAAFVERMAAGVYLSELKVTTRPCKVEKLSKFTFRIILTQGLNRQIRRMCKELGFHVTGIKRVRIMNIHLGHLTTGGYRNVTEAEIQELMYLLEDSSNEPGYLQELNEDDMQDDE